MIPIWIGKIVANKIIKSIKHKVDLNKIDKYVNKPNELDIQIVLFSITHILQLLQVVILH